MGIIATFKKAFKLRLEQLKGESFIGKQIYYRKKLRKVIKENSDQIWLKGINEPLSKHIFRNHYKFSAPCQKSGKNSK